MTTPDINFHFDCEIDGDKIKITIWAKDDKSDIKEETFLLHEYIAESIRDALVINQIKDTLGYKVCVNDEVDDDT